MTHTILLVLSLTILIGILLVSIKLLFSRQEHLIKLLAVTQIFSIVPFFLAVCFDDYPEAVNKLKTRVDFDNARLFLDRALTTPLDSLPHSVFAKPEIKETCQRIVSFNAIALFLYIYHHL